MKKEKDMDIYPLTIIADRYSGTYSGGAYTAWNLDCWDIPDGPDGGDTECMMFWDNADKYYIIGRGGTPDEAVADLERRLVNKGIHEITIVIDL